MNSSRIFSIAGKTDFEKNALAVFRFQSENNPVYKSYLEHLGINPAKVKSVQDIPFLPIEFFKTHQVVSKGETHAKSVPQLFLSSGTTGMERSKHYVSDISLYEKSFRKSFELFYGDVKQYAVLALLPSYYENKNSSLIYMTMDLIKESRNACSGFYNAKDENLLQVLNDLLKKKQNILLLGVAFALLDLPFSIRDKNAERNLTVMETGGMKGRKEEITREELHATLCEKFGVKKIHSEYGMTELLSQAYSKEKGIFKCPPWMKVLIRDLNDPFRLLPPGKTGAINIIDLANVNSCSFIATQDAGRVHRNGAFEVLGRVDNSDLRGCSLMVA